VTFKSVKFLVFMVFVDSIMNDFKRQLFHNQTNHERAQMRFIVLLLNYNVNHDDEPQFAAWQRTLQSTAWNDDWTKNRFIASKTPINVSIRYNKICCNY